MPGSSLWLLLPSNHPLQAVIETLIKKTSAHFNSPHLFIPHVTLTSNIDPSSYEPDPQKWINDLKFPVSQDVVVRFQNLQSEDIFVKKLYVQVEKPGLEKLARIARTAVSGYGDLETAKTWVDREYRPHLSLLYHDCPEIDNNGIGEIEKLVKEAGVELKGVGESGGWVGGRVVLVDTSKPINQWVPIAERVL